MESSRRAAQVGVIEPGVSMQSPPGLGFWREIVSSNRHFIAGGIGGMAGATLTCPLEVVKTQLQSKTIELTSVRQIIRNIAQSEGVPGFWKGLVPMLAGVVPARAVYFYTYSGSKNFLLARGHKEAAPTHLTAAVVAGTITATVINPIWVIKTRLQLQDKQSVQTAKGELRYNGTLHATRLILKEEGVRGFFKGLIPSYWGISESALHFVLYEALKQRIAARNVERGVEIVEGGGKNMRNYELMAAAGCAKFVASTATYPHEVIRTRMRERGASLRYNSSIHCVQKVWIEEGMRGLYAGLGVHLLRVVPNTIIIFFTYEKVSALLK
mmetsp:Transcript_15781/g.37395  ORF Transcript_15781/g.37395 Transcript_15781/m.37395 type:complete len:326 (+) Transcript_15781:176-1153(+)